MAGTITWAEALARLTVPGELVQSLEDGWVRCYACGHVCRIPPGRPGICQVRFNDAGTLRVPHGYVAAVACDPIEKKPFYHALPGTDAYSFGMLGCDLHCGYCFPGDTVVVTDGGPMRLAEVFDSTPGAERATGAWVARPKSLRVVTATGRERPVRAIFKHSYRGPLVVIRPRYLPPLRCTPDHRVFASRDPGTTPESTPANQLSAGMYLAIPRLHAFGEGRQIDAWEVLEDLQVTYRVPWKLTEPQREMIGAWSSRGRTSREIAGELGTSASYVRHVRSKLRRGLAGNERRAGPFLEGDRVRFPNEHAPGIQRIIPLDPRMAKLLGYYCAEGCSVRAANRPNSVTVCLTFAPSEAGLAAEAVQLFEECTGMPATVTVRPTSIAVEVRKTSVARLFSSLCGARAAKKHVPIQVMQAPHAVIRAFVDAYVRGDGHRYANGKVSVTTVSPRLAQDVAWLALKLGHVPSIYEYSTPGTGVVLGRTVNRSPQQCTVVWYENSAIKRDLLVTEDHHLIPILEVQREPFAGDVYNLEVEEEHSYLAGFFAVSNCQNWETSQAVRDPQAVAPPRPITADEIVARALRRGASTVASTYNEPLITAEWAVEVFRKAKARGLKTAFVSNGNATQAVLDYLVPWVDLYKVDLKSFDDRAYRRLGGRLGPILDTIPRLVKMGFWVEVVTLLIPGFNDSDAELGDLARFLAGISADIPWHVTAFHKDYKMTDPDDTPTATLLRAWEIGRTAGLRYVYPGNRPGRVGDRESTHCHACGQRVIERLGYNVLRNVLRDGRCPGCGTAIPGVWR